MSAQASPQAMSPAEFRAAVAKMRATYPNERSAVLPALRLAQQRHGGWLPEEAFREVADALGETPAYCLSIASFYDMSEYINLITLSGAQSVVDAFERELGVHVGGTAADGTVTLRTVECLGGCGWATVVALDNHHRLGVRAGDVPGIAKELRGSA